MRCKAITNQGERCRNEAVGGTGYCHLTKHQAQAEGAPSTSLLNDKQERFCQLYVSKDYFANGTQSYIEAYGIKVKTKQEYDTASASASRLLSNDKICRRINEMLEEAGLNDNFVDKQLLFLIQQHTDYKTKIAAIREYNKLKSRITDKLDVTSDGDKITGINVVIRDGDAD